MKSGVTEPVLTHTLIIGYGNTLRRDDGVGPMIIQWLRQIRDATVRECLTQSMVETLPNGRVSDDLQFLDAHQLLPEHAEPVSNVRRVIFIDADITVAPGRVKFRRIHAKMPSNPSVGHNVSPELILTLADALYGHAPPATVIAIGVSSLDLGEGLTPQVESVARRLVKHLSYWLTR